MVGARGDINVQRSVVYPPSIVQLDQDLSFLCEGGTDFLIFINFMQYGHLLSSVHMPRSVNATTFFSGLSPAEDLSIVLGTVESPRRFENEPAEQNIISIIWVV